MALLVAVANGVPVLAYVAAGSEPVASKTARLRVLDLNVHSKNPHKDRVIALLRETKPDLALLQEIDPAWQRALADVANQLPFSKFVPQSDDFGIAILSRFPLEDVRIEAGPAFVPTIFARVRVDGVALRIVTTHPLPPGSIGTRLRDRQLDELAAMIALDSSSVLVAGDLNVSPWSPAFDRFLATASLRDGRRGFGLLPTWPADAPFGRIAIDHVLVGGGVVVTSLRRGPDVGSDHLPLVAEIAL